MSDECLFCKISAGEIPSDTVYEDDQVIAFNDINPLAPVHVLIVPRRHIPTLNDATESDKALLGHMLHIAAQMAKEKGIDGPGYRAVLNVNPDGGQVIFHLHMHVLGGRQMKDPPG